MPDDPKEGAEKSLSTFANVTHIHCKCVTCNLHFKIYTWYPKNWKEREPICPECGNQTAVMKLRFIDVGQGFIDFG